MEDFISCMAYGMSEREVWKKKSLRGNSSPAKGVVVRRGYRNCILGPFIKRKVRYREDFLGRKREDEIGGSRKSGAEYRETVVWDRGEKGRGHTGNNPMSKKIET